MDMSFLYHRLDVLAARMYTRLLKRSFKTFGRESLVFFPNRIDNPDRIEIGQGVTVHSGCWLNAVDEWAGARYDGYISIGDFCGIAHGVEISACLGITLGRYAALGKNTVVSDHIHDYRDVNVPYLSAPLAGMEPIHIEEEAMIMANCVIAPGVTIGRHSFIGAGSVVLHDVPSFCMAAGNPARVIRCYNPRSGEWEKVRT